MLTRDIRLLNFDGSVKSQPKLIFQYHSEVWELEDLGPAARLWMSQRTANLIDQRIRNSSSNRVTFLGSGDFHHLSSLLINQIKEPISLIVFDFHPDWDILPPRLGCGSWVTQALRNQYIQKCLLIGVSSNDLSWPGIQSADLNSLREDKLEVYPFSHNPTTVFLRQVPKNRSLRLKKSLLSTKIFWSELKDNNLEDFFLAQVLRLPTKKVYVSIDKDCLSSDSALTNWEEGKLSLDQLLMMLRIIKEKLDIVGLDITGDYSKISVSGIIKGVVSRLDHPKEIKANKFPQALVTSINETTNLKILDVLNS
jgi:arginase family enzyme